MSKCDCNAGGSFVNRYGEVDQHDPPCPVCELSHPVEDPVGVIIEDVDDRPLKSPVDYVMRFTVPSGTRYTFRKLITKHDKPWQTCVCHKCEDLEESVALYPAIKEILIPVRQVAYCSVERMSNMPNHQAYTRGFIKIHLSGGGEAIAIALTEEALKELQKGGLY